MGNLQSVNHQSVLARQAVTAVSQVLAAKSVDIATIQPPAYFHPPQDAQTEAHTQSLVLGIVVLQSILTPLLVHILPELSVQNLLSSSVRLSTIIFQEFTVSQLPVHTLGGKLTSAQ